MQKVKNNREKELLKKEFQNVKIGFLKQNLNLRLFCDLNKIDRRHVYRIFNGTLKGEKATALKNRIIEAARGKK